MATAALIGGAISAVGAIQQGRAESRAAKHNAAISSQQAEVARQNAKFVKQQAKVQAGQVARINRLREGAIRAAAGASGVTQGGSVAEVLADVAAQGELERQQAIFEGDVQARGLLAEAAGAQSTAALDLMRGRAARTGSFLQAGASLFGGVSSFHRQGGFGIKRGG